MDAAPEENDNVEEEQHYTVDNPSVVSDRKLDKHKATHCFYFLVNRFSTCGDSRLELVSRNLGDLIDCMSMYPKHVDRCS